MSKRRETALRSRDHWTESIGVQTLPGAIDSAEVPGYAHIAGDVHVGGTVPAAGMPSTVRTGELIASVNLRTWSFASQGQHRAQADQDQNADNFSHHSPLRS